MKTPNPTQTPNAEELNLIQHQTKLYADEAEQERKYAEKAFEATVQAANQGDREAANWHAKSVQGFAATARMKADRADERAAEAVTDTTANANAARAAKNAERAERLAGRAAQAAQDTPPSDTPSTAPAMTEETRSAAVGHARQFIADCFEGIAGGYAEDAKKHADNAEKMLSTTLDQIGSWLANGAQYTDWEEELEDAARKAEYEAREADDDATNADEQAEWARRGAEAVATLLHTNIDDQARAVEEEVARARREAQRARAAADQARALLCFYNAHQHTEK